MSESWDALVVDDEPVVCDAIRLVLGEEGMRVAVVGDVASALTHEALATCRLVFCDLMLPGESGLDAVRAIRQRRPTLPVVMITGYATAENHARALEAGATAVLPKPFDDTELLALTRHVLARTEAARLDGTS